jgi:hypothetical protein
LALREEHKRLPAAETAFFRIMAQSRASDTITDDISATLTAINLNEEKREQ